MQHRYGFEDSTYQAVGGFEGLVKLVTAFYEAMDTLPEAKKIRAMHQENLEESRDKLVYFLSGWMGGSRIYAEKYGAISIPMAHQHLRIKADDKAAWLACMKAAIIRLDYPEALQIYLLEQLQFPANRIHQVSQTKHGHMT